MTSNPISSCFVLLKTLLLGSVDSFPGTAGLPKEGKGWAIEKQLGRGSSLGGAFPSWPSQQEPQGMWCGEAILGWGEYVCGMGPSQVPAHKP